MLDLYWTKWQWGRFSPSTSVSLAHSHFTCYSTFIVIITSGAGTLGQLVADVPSELNLTSPQETKKKKGREIKRILTGIAFIFFLHTTR
jgi:hypothetical protein